MARRADRLFALVSLLRGRRIVTAKLLAERLGVSERTIYRDVDALQASGVPIDASAGTGYRLRAGYDLPPMLFDAEELAALAVGARMVEAWAGHALADGARRALARVEAALPAERRAHVGAVRVYAPGFFVPDELRSALDLLTEAIEARRVVRVDYTRLDGAHAARALEPLALHFWGGVWTLAAFCRLRADLRVFRVDRLAALEPLEERFEARPGADLEALLAREGARRE